MKCILFLSSLFLSFLSVSAQQKIDYGNNKVTGRYYDIRGIKMYCEIYGKGKPLLLIHGNGGSINSFAGNIPFLSQK
jgi:pimeloyl-ACP methyl ester carboxylesterase